MYSKSKILIVDDDEILIELTKENLSVLGVEILTAKNGQEAVEILGEQEISVAIIDYRMPHINGVELMEYIRDCCKFVVTIFLTGFADYNELAYVISLGVFDYIEKPYNPLILEHRVKNALEKNLRDRLAFHALREFVKDKCEDIDMLHESISIEDNVLYKHVRDALMKMGYNI